MVSKGESCGMGEWVWEQHAAEHAKQDVDFTCSCSCMFCMSQADLRKVK